MLARHCGLPTVACLALAIFAAQCVAEVAEKDADGVYLLDHNSFDDTVKSKDVVVVYFHTTWCDECKKFQANWTEVQKNLADFDNVAFATLNAENAQSLAEQYRVASFPSLVTFRDGTYFPYDSSNRSVAAITHVVKDFAQVDWTKPDEFSDHLTMGEFEETVKKGDGMLVVFYVRWCGHCRAMATEWDRAARACDRLEPPMKMYRVDCEAEKDLCVENKVEGYPTLRFYRDGKIVEVYHGERKKAAFIDYLRHKTGPPSKKLDATPKRLTEHIDALHRLGKPAIIGFFPDEDIEAFETFELVAGQIRDKVEIVHVVSKDLGKKYGIEGEYGLYLSHPEHLRSKYEKKSHVLNSFADDKDELKNWIYKTSRPLVGYLQSHNTGIDNVYWNKATATIYYTVDFGKEMLKSTQFWRQRFLKIAKDYQNNDKLVFAVADDESYAAGLQSMGLGDNSFDVIFAISGPDGKEVFPFNDDFDEDSYREHIDQYLAGTLEPYAKSEPVPANNNGPVKIGVANNFKQLYRDVAKHIIIFFYVPWCPHCRDFEPIFLKAARKFKDNNDVTFMKYNMMENQLPKEFEGKVDSYPSVYFRRRGEKQTIKYEGGPILDTIIKYVDANMAIRDEL